MGERWDLVFSVCGKEWEGGIKRTKGIEGICELSDTGAGNGHGKEESWYW